MEELIKYIVDSYNSLWKVKKHGNTWEIVTPIATTSNIFVSVFFTKRGEDYIVTDGGWIERGMYEHETYAEDIYYSKLFDYYLKDFEINTLEYAGYQYYYKKVQNPQLVPNLIYDLSNFINAVISASFITFEEKKEREQIGRFKKKATSFIHDIVGEDSLKTNYSIHEDLAIKFNAVVFQKDRMTLVNYVTGSNNTNFISSLGRSNLNYDMVDTHSINRFINQKITLVDDTAKSINPTRIAPYLESIGTKVGRTFVRWNEREKLREIIET